MKGNKCCVLILTSGVSKDFITQGAGTGYSFLFLIEKSPEYLHTFVVLVV